jgi:hypothetical protein
MKIFRKSLCLKHSILRRHPLVLWMEGWRGRKREGADLVDKWVQLSLTCCYDSYEMSSLCAAVYSRSSYLKILRVQDWRKSVQIENFSSIQS